MKQDDWIGWGHADELEAFDSGWHAHDTHQLLHASRGILRVELAGARWFLPPGRGAWIRARTEHRVETARAALRTLYVHPDQAGPGEPVVVFRMPPLAREMVIHAQRFGHEARGQALARDYFALLLALCHDAWFALRHDFSLPLPDDPALARAIDHLHDDLAGATLESAASAAFVSARTLTRRFKQELGMTWRVYTRQARLIQAMHLLEAGEPVGQVAFDVGFDSPSAFTRSFQDFTGQLPSQMRRT